MSPAPPAADAPLRVLFVDDDDAVLSALRRMLRPQRQTWEMSFVESASAALAEVSRRPFDVVVTDMRMPGIDGAGLLRILQERCPDTVRIVLSGHAELGAVLRSIPVAHQYLTKPCDAGQLRRAIAGAYELRQLLACAELRRMVGEIGSLPSLPASVAALNEVMTRPDPDVDEVARVVERDVAMSAKVLQLVNSSFFGLAIRVQDVKQAIAYLGMETVRDLAVSFEAFRAFEAGTGLPPRWMAEFTAHSMAVSEMVGRLVGPGSLQREAVLAGLLHDVGELILAARLPEQLVMMRRVAARDHRSVEEVEREYLGSTHGQLGGYLLSLWGARHATVEAVTLHHQLRDDPDGDVTPRDLVIVADALVRATAPEALRPAHPDLPDEAIAALGLTERVRAVLDLHNAPGAGT